MHFQWIAFNCGFVAEEPEHDYGYDLVLFTYSAEGKIENGIVYVQLKATDSLASQLIDNGETISYSVERRHIELWQAEPMPVIFVVYDAIQETAYWLYVQRHLQSSPLLAKDKQKEVRLRIPIHNRLDAAAFGAFQRFKNEILHRIRRVPLHHE